MTRRLVLLVADADTGEVMQAGKPSGLQIISTKYFEALKVLNQSRVDLSGAEVKLPELSEGTEGPDDYGDGRNEVIRDIQAQMKGE